MLLAKRVASWWRSYILILTPLVLLPIVVINPTPVSKCAFMMLLMAIYWVFEALPIGVTALLPVVLVPALGLMKSKDLCPNYMKDTCLLFMGGLLVAVAVGKWNLHKRIALRVLLIVGTKPKWLMLGFMLPTWFLSMWISNTATTPMMVSIVIAVLEQMKETTLTKKRNSYVKVDGIELNPGNGVDVEFLPQEHGNQTSKEDEAAAINEQKDGLLPLFVDTDESFRSMCKAMLLSICFSANVGGIATLTGTPPNLVLKGLLDIIFPGQSGINFTSWIVFAMPLSIINLVLCWLWLQILYMGPKRTFCGKGDEEDPAIKRIIRESYDGLGPMTWAEGSCLVMFIATALLWLTRDPGFVPGWASLFKDGYVTDATAGIFISIILFMVPSKAPSCNSFAPVPLLDWKSVNNEIPWHIILLLGGGFALADVSQVSGLSQWIGTLLSGLKALSPSLIAFVISVSVGLLTNLFSNTATATLMLPILADLSVIINVNPLYLMLPTTIAASFAFMLPVATPPNAMVYSTGYITIKDMVIAGSLMNLLCVFTVSFAINTYGYAFFDLGTYPAWAGGPIINATTTSDFTSLYLLYNSTTSPSTVTNF